MLLELPIQYISLLIVVNVISILYDTLPRPGDCFLPDHAFRNLSDDHKTQISVLALVLAHTNQKQAEQ
jgi:hypothetical protein